MHGQQNILYICVCVCVCCVCMYVIVNTLHVGDKKDK